MIIYNATIIQDIKDSMATVLDNMGILTTITDEIPTTLEDTDLPLAYIDSGDATYRYDNTNEIEITRTFFIDLFVTRQDRTHGVITDRNDAETYLTRIPLELMSSDRLNRLDYVKSIMVAHEPIDTK